MATSTIQSGFGVVQRFSVPNQTEITFTIDSHYRGLMIIVDSNTRYQGMWIIAMGGNGQLYASKVYGDDSYITISNSAANKLKVTLASARESRVGFLSLGYNTAVYLSS